jgi:murein DD-endopeptidase MepM/ murein hydrolase activator NlpD
MSRFCKQCVVSVFLFAIVTLASNLFAQEKVKQLENQRIQLEKSIEYTEVLLEGTRKSKFASLDELALLNNQISNRQKLIDTYLEERDSREDTIFYLLFKIDEMATEVDALKEEYARMIYSAYKNKNSYQRMFYVLASDDLNQAYRRMNYYKVYASRRKDQVQLINNAEKEYSSKVDALELSINNTEKLLARLESEKILLEKEKQRKDLAVENLSRQEKELISKQNNRKKRAAELKQHIETIITENLHAPINPANTNALISITPEDELLNTNFSLNRGHLPWPLEKGIVSSFFGEHNHPDLQEIKVRNNGINIVTQAGSKARAVFNGEVTRVMAMPNFNNVVIIRHGSFLTVYTNLEEVFVKPGSHVVTKEDIGVVFTDNEQLKTELHFEIWEGKTLLDPEKWLASDKSSELLHNINP